MTTAATTTTTTTMGDGDVGAVEDVENVGSFPAGDDDDAVEDEQNDTADVADEQRSDQKEPEHCKRQLERLRLELELELELKQAPFGRLNRTQIHWHSMAFSIRIVALDSAQLSGNKSMCVGL
ncbi:hypothetical protein AWZ03_007629 [Drosophila navojoa]|uniref:Uncharacterized protein n=1 Tax=Drosophila navojoa TaxID=7232 RepID=A0A484BB45_DRONA|nr:hypothetical protein AWZ03_007629 [Drosophila navojoa]